MERVHQLTLQLSAHLALDRDRKHVLLQERIPLNDIRAHGWTPLLLYGVTCATTRLKSVRIVASDVPQSLLLTLIQQWRDDTWLKGRPDRVVLSVALAGAAPALVESLSCLGIDVDARGGKSYEANRRAIEADYWACLPWTKSKDPAYTIAEMNESLRRRLDPGDLNSPWDSPKGRELKADWLATSYRPVIPLTAEGTALDWTYGAFCEIAFRSIVPPSDAERVGPVQPGSRVFDTVDVVGAPTLDVEFRELLGAWPETLPQVARQIGATEPGLRAYLRGRPVLHPAVEARLCDLFTVRPHLFHDDILEVAGPCLLIARSIRAANAAYNVVTHGGDVDFATEVVPEDREPHSEWHLIVIGTCGVHPSFLLIPRTTKSLPKPWHEALINVDRKPFKAHRNEYDALMNRVLVALATAEHRTERLHAVINEHRWLFDRLESDGRRGYC